MRDDDEPIKRQRIYATKIVDALEGHAEEACDVLKVPRKRSRDEEEVCSCYGYSLTWHAAPLSLSLLHSACSIRALIC